MHGLRMAGLHHAARYTHSPQVTVWLICEKAPYTMSRVVRLGVPLPWPAPADQHPGRGKFNFRQWQAPPLAQVYANKEMVFGKELVIIHNKVCGCLAGLGEGG